VLPERNGLRLFRRRIRRIVGFVTAELDEPAINQQQQPDTGQRHDDAEQENNAVIFTRAVENVAEQRTQQHVGDRQDHGQRGIELGKERPREKPHGQRRNHREIDTRQQAVQEKNDQIGLLIAHNKQPGRHGEQIQHERTDRCPQRMETVHQHPQEEAQNKGAEESENPDVRDRAFSSLDLLQKVIEFKQKFYPRSWARYDEAAAPTIKLLPPDYRMTALAADYAAMRDMLYGDVPMFGTIVDAIAVLEKEIHSLQ